MKRAKLRAKLAAAIQQWMPTARDPLYLRRHFQRADLASTFNIRRETMITLADWTAAMELVDQPTVFDSDPVMTLRLHSLEEAIKYFESRHNTTGAEQARLNLAQFLELHPRHS